MNSHILPVIAIFVSIGIFFGYIGPTWSGSIADTKAAIELNNQALVAATEYADKQNELMEARSAIDPSNLERIEVFLPDSVDNVGLILDMNALAARSGIVLSNIDVVTGSPGSGTAEGALPMDTVDPMGSVNMSLSAIGSFAAMQTFLNGIEKSARLLDVQDLSVKGSDTGIYTYQMTLRLYWLR